MAVVPDKANSTGIERANARFDLTGTVAWVPGGYGTLGRHISTALAEHGAHVVVSGRHLERAEEVAAAIRQDGLSAEAARLDAGDEREVEHQAADIVQRHGRLDSCVNLTYHSTGKSFTALSAADWEAGLRVTSLGAFLIGRAAADAMSAGGSIVQFSSMYGMVSPNPAVYAETQSINPVDYGVAKAGVLQLVRYQAVLHARQGIRVNAIVPGPFPGEAARRDRAFIERLSDRVPMGRTGNPEELTGAVVFLCSNASSFMTGTSIVVDGGWTAW